MKLTSSDFKENGTVPARFTCDGANVNPPLEFHDVPKESLSLALIVDDPDVPEFVRKDRMWVHWVVFDLPPTVKGIAEAEKHVPGTAGKGTGGELTYQGPCPPDREHRYYFKLYALDKKLQLPQGATKADVEKAMAGHVIAEAQLMGRYDRPRK